jgi:S-adenosyl-L-methionine hydrolase (adenosine-forming)
MSAAPHPTITLTTDFGTSDHFVGVMKGVIAGIAPGARVIDITHEIKPYDILEGAFVIAQAWRYFPKNTIHVVVVDPGVGSARRPILAEASDHFFIAPDNGVLSLIYDAIIDAAAASKAKVKARLKVRVISNPRLMAHDISRTFHGRDIFAPAAAHLARGAQRSKFGELIHDYVRLTGIKPRQVRRGLWHGMILKADRFGNLITNFHIDHFAKIKTRAFELRVGDQRIHRLALTFSEVAIGDLAIVVGSSGYIEIAANQASAATLLGCGAGAEVQLKTH